MRFGSHKVPFRVLIAGVSLLGLGVAAALPTVANETARSAATGDQVDPIMTGTIDKVDANAPTRTQLPPTTDTSTSPTPRQILPTAPEAVIATEGERAVAVSDPVVEPAMTQPAMTQPAMTQQARTPASGMRDREIVEPGMMGSMAANTLAPTTTTLAGEASDAGGIILALDHARVMRVVGDVSTIIIGNPFIADASMPDPGTIVLTGKSYGETNMVMMDSNGAIVAEQTLRVTVRGQSLVSVYRGVQRTTLSCSPTCEIRPTPGDAGDSVEAGIGAFQARNQAALNAVRSD